MIGILAHSAQAAETINIDVPPRGCPIGTCPTDLLKVTSDPSNISHAKYTCVKTLEDFKLNPSSHYWIEDPSITAQGQANERARQFLNWTMSHNAIDDHLTLKEVWKITRNIAIFLVVLISALMGVGYIIGQRTQFNTKVNIWSSVFKIAGALLFIMFSASLVLVLIQLSEVLMKFFIENMGGKNLFNTYFGGISQEDNYNNFIGCRDLNYNVQEAVKSELFLLNLTNITYYIMGVMILLRKVILWFLLFLSPFLAVLFPFAFVRNVGWIWVGVFFQWLFYGPLFALFLGGLNLLWSNGIPFVFDFSRVNDPNLGYVYPTGINLVFGGPAQIGAGKISALNNANYIDTFVEYIITLIMLWAVIFFPWWLLRIFRDYCCDGINAMKNILMSMYDKARNNPPHPPTPPNNPNLPGLTKNLTSSINSIKETETRITSKLTTLEEIKRTKTEDISKSLNLTATKLTDIARFETNKSSQESVKKNLELLSNPVKASSPAERQKFMNMRTELFNRSIKQDTVARQMLSATSSSRSEQIQKRQEILSTVTNAVANVTPVMKAVSVKVNMTNEKVTSISNSLSNSISSNAKFVSQVAQNTNVTSQQVQTILTSFKQNMTKPSTLVTYNIAKETGIEKTKVASVIRNVSQEISTNKEVAAEVAKKEGVTVQQVQNVVAAQMPMIVEPEKHVEDTITIPSTVAIEDYEEVKKMWIEQYQKGEVPTTENISDRDEWIEQDIVYLENILNKLMSSDDAMKQQAMDEIGFILPIFMINNLKGDDLLVYLKAKIEGAKQVQSDREKEKAIEAKVRAEFEKKDDEDNLVEVKRSKKEVEKTMDLLSDELPIEGEGDSKEGDGPKPIEALDGTPPATGPQTPSTPNEEKPAGS
jgi:hypothetical protein